MKDNYAWGKLMIKTCAMCKQKQLLVIINWFPIADKIDTI